MWKQRPRKVKYVIVGHKGEKNKKVLALCNNKLTTIAHLFLRYCKNPWKFPNKEEVAIDAVE